MLRDFPGRSNSTGQRNYEYCVGRITRPFRQKFLDYKRGCRLVRLWIRWIKKLQNRWARSNFSTLLVLQWLVLSVWLDRGELMSLNDIKKIISKNIKKIFVRYVWTIDAINGVDTLKKNRVTYIPEVQNNVIISGWLFDAKEDNTIVELCVEIDGTNYHALYGLMRTDVSFEYKEKRFKNSGFRCVIPKREFQSGKVYAINLRIKTRKERNETLNTSISFAISEEKTRGLQATSSEILDYSQYVGELLLLKYIAGTGIEIGALHAPSSVDSKKASVLYVDRLAQQDLYAQYPEFKKYDIVAADIIDNGDELATIPDNAYDFCISNHVLEHLEDPIKALGNWMRILKPKGLLFLSIPLPYNIVDKNRQPTSLSHIIDDYGLMARDRETYARKRHNHFLDFVRSTNLSESANDAFINSKTSELMDLDYSIHFHVFSEETLLQVIDYISKKNPLKIIEFVKNEPEEFIVIIEKQA
jgi:SAM-dependent methyltransferase